MEETASKEINGFKRSWNNLKMGQNGRSVLTCFLSPAVQSGQSPVPVVRLPVPNLLRSLEAAKAQQVREAMEELQKCGVDTTQIPQNELEADGAESETVRMHLMWSRYLANKRSRGYDLEASEMEDILRLVLDWRDSKAIELSMAPTAVMTDYVAKKIVYTRAFSIESLRDAGLRIVGYEGLAASIAALINRQEQARPAPPPGTCTTSATAATSDIMNNPIELPVGVWKALQPWKHAVYKAGTKGQLPLWKEGCRRFQSGESMLKIAMQPPSGRSVIQVNTVGGYLLTGLLFGEPIDLRRMTHEWTQSDGSTKVQLTNKDVYDFEQAAISLRMDFESEEFVKNQSKDILKFLLVGSDIDMDMETRSMPSHDQERVAVLYSKVRIWKHFRVMGLLSSIDSDSNNYKRQRVGEC